MSVLADPTFIIPIVTASVVLLVTMFNVGDATAVERKQKGRAKLTFRRRQCLHRVLPGQHLGYSP